MQIRWSAAIALGALVLVSGCATAIEGQAVAGTAAPTSASSEASDTADQSGPPADTTGSETPAPSTTTEEPPATSLEPIPPIDPTRETTVSPPDPATTSGGGAAPTGDPLAAPPFLGSTPADPASFPGLVTEVGFQSPSGNIACGFYDDGVACQIAEYDFSIPPRPDECGDTGWGFNFAVDDISGYMFCAGDVEGGGPTLAYGQQLAVGDYHCVSREDGVTCINAVNGGGFTLAHDAYELF